MSKKFADLMFDPHISQIVPEQLRGSLNIFTGYNNSGKSAYLKQLVDQTDKLYIGVSRFYSFHHLSFYNDNTDELFQFYQNLRNAKLQAYQNFEGAFFNASSALTRLTNERRQILFDTFKSLFGTSIEVLAENPNNDFSNRYIAVDGDSLSITSSGTRLFLGLLAALMDERFKVVAIDEPELGLSPILQRRLADIIIKGEHRDELFPHKPNVILSTHSHLFLDKNVPANNWVVSRVRSNIFARRCTGVPELHDIQLRLLGNDLGELFLPHAVLFVEGETDKMYLERIVKLKLSHLRVVIQDCGGDIAQRLSYWAQSIGDMQLSPYRDRTFAVYDKIEQSGLNRVCARIGLPDANKVKWTGNGIEFLYPNSIMSSIFRKDRINVEDIIIDADAVSYNGLSYKKIDLCRMVCDSLEPQTELPDELVKKLIDPLIAFGR